MIIDLIIQFLVAMLATISFAIVFSSPKSDLAFCGISGAVGWIGLFLLTALGYSMTLGNLLGAFALTVLSRSFAVIRKNPVTIYLISGIFPLVPGAGIYYTSYYLIMNDMTSFSQYGITTLKTAGAIVMGIILGMAFPQVWFNKAFAPFCRK